MVFKKTNLKFACILIMFSMLFANAIILIPRTVSAAIQATYYASPTGSGSTCSESSPCSLTGARDKVRTVNGNMTGDIVVNLRGGTYALSSTFQLTESSSVHDSGTNGYNVIYQAFAGETPILSGGTTVTGWTLHDSGKNIYKANAGSIQTRQLYVNGIRAVRARGEDFPSGFTKTTSGYTLGAGSYSGMANWKNVSDIEVSNYADWKNIRCGISNISGSTVTMKNPCWSNAQLHAPWTLDLPRWIENAYELLDTAGEFYLDSSGAVDGTSVAKVYYKPRANENLSTATVVAPTLETLVSGTGTLDNPLHHIQFHKITFSYATWLTPNTNTGYADVQAGYHLEALQSSFNADFAVKTPANVTFYAAKSIRMERNTFKHLGAEGLNFLYGSQDNVIIGNRFEDISGTGIHLGDNNDKNPSDIRARVKSNTIQNNFITNIAVEYKDGVGIFGGYTSYTTIAHNEVQNVPYTPISLGWGWGDETTYVSNNVIQYNKIHDYMQILRDGGGIYTLGNQASSTMSNNYIYNMSNDYGSIYTDNGSAYWNVNNNVVANTPKWLFIWHPNIHDITVQNNYSDTSNMRNDGTNITINNNTVVSGGNWPTAAQTIMNNAGLESAYLDIKSSIPAPNTPNLALNKSVTADSSNSANEAPAKAVDGIIASNSKWASTGASASHWLQIDLGASTSINQFIVRHAEIGGENSVLNTKDFNFQVSLDGSSWTTVINVVGNTAAETSHTFSTTQARYVKFNVTAANQNIDNYARIDEVEIYGDGASNSANLALNKSATADSSNSAAEVAGKAVDGVTDSNSKWASTNASSSHWMQIDLGSLRSINQFVVKHAGAGGESAGYNTKDFNFQVSSDGTNWSTVATVTGNTANETTHPITSTQARYVKLNVTAANQNVDNHARIDEVEVYGVSALGQIEAESYNAMNGVQTETTSDINGGQNVGWIDTGDWMDYSSLNVQSANIYTVQFRVASPNNGAQLQLRNASGTVLATVNVPNTGGWQSWQTVSASVSLPSGSQTLRLHASSGGFNINWFNFTGSAANLARNKSATSDSSNSTDEVAGKAVDGVVASNSKWASTASSSSHWMQVDLGSLQTISQFVVKHAGAGGEQAGYNTRDFNFQVSSDGTNWSTVVTVTGNTANETTHPITSTQARYVKLNITTATQNIDNHARIDEVEVY